MVELDEIAVSGLNVVGLPKNIDDLKDIEARYQQSGSFVVAEIGDEIVGMGAIRYLDQKTALVSQMRVHPNHQRKGIARTVLNWLEHQAEVAEISTVLLRTLANEKKAQELYESNGYFKTGKGKLDRLEVFMYAKEISAKT